MRILVIKATDIHSCTFGLVEFPPTTPPIEETFTTSPEHYLALLNQFLTQHHTDLKTLTHIAVATGPGSFTASRVSVVLANTLAFTLNIPIIPLTVPSITPSVQTQDLASLASLASLVSHTFAIPTYATPPHITQPKKR